MFECLHLKLSLFIHFYYTIRFVIKQLHIRSGTAKKADRIAKEGEEGGSFGAIWYTDAMVTDYALRESDLASFLPPGRADNIFCLDSVGSTNEDLKERTEKGAGSGTVVIAAEQSGGKGRIGRGFYSPKGTGLYLSYLLSANTEAEDMIPVTAWTAVAVLRAIRDVTGLSCGIKWVNDLILNKKKVCGILSEMGYKKETGQLATIVIGIGINVNQEVFPEDLSKKATSLYLEGKKKTPLTALAAEIIRNLDRLAADFPDRKESYLNEYRKSSLLIGKDVTVLSGNTQKKATALAVNEDFSLQLRYADGTTEALSSGEVSVRGEHGYV